VTPLPRKEKMAQTPLLTQGLRGFSEETVRELSRLKEEPAWLRQRRLDAWEVCQATPMPTLQDEDWRRTDIREIPFDNLLPYSQPSRTGGELPRELRPLLDLGKAHAGHLIQEDSEVVFASLGEAASGDGVIFVPLDEAVHQHQDLAKQVLLGEGFPASRGKFAALNAALFSGGAFLYVPKDVEVVLPLQATRWLSSQGVAVFPHTVVIMEAGAKATLIEEYYSAPLAGPSLVCPGIEVYLRPGAQLRHISIQQLARSAYVLGTHRALLERDSRLDYLAVAVGGRLTKAYTDVVLQGDGAHARLLGLVFGDGEQHFDHQTLQEHIGVNASSDLLFKVVVKDNAMSVHYGTVRVHKGARGTDAGQAVRNLILSAGAKAHPILPLEIEASDIRRCSHAAAIGQIDENQLFYLQSRGFTRRQAEKLVVDGFFEPVMAAIPLEGVQERLRRAIDSKLPGD